MNLPFDLYQYEELANAIILQAAKDYKDILNGCSESTLKNKEELEQFFLSEYFATLTHLDGKVLIKDLRQIVHEEQEAKRQRDGTISPVENIFKDKNYITGEHKISA